MKRLYDEIESLKGNIVQMGKVIKVLEKNNQQLIKENEKHNDSLQG